MFGVFFLKLLPFNFNQEIKLTPYTMKSKIIVFFIILFHSNISAQQHDIPFKKGEKLKYKIHYGPITAGTANLEVETLQNKYKFIANGETNRLFSLFFEVKDFYQSIVDKKSLEPDEFYRNVKEGGYKKIENVFFNHILNQAETTRDTISLPENPPDILSIFYYLRTQNFDNLTVNDSIPIQVYLDDNFINSELYGRYTDLPWGVKFIQIDNITRHPSQIYEALFEGIILFIILNFVFLGFLKRPGVISGLFLILYSIFRFFIEFTREPDLHLGLLFLDLSLGQLISLITIIIGIIIVYFKYEKNFFKN